MEQHLKVILSGGGTGGHIYPAVAIANEIKWRFPQAEILFVGAKDKMEMQKIPQSGYPIIGLWISGLQRKQIFKNLLFPIKLMHSLYKARKIIKKFKPDVVVGTGGFASGPLLWVAEHRGVFTVIQEQNSFPGITNKLLGKKAHAICVAYQNLDCFFPKNKIVITGNPVRQDLLQIENKKEEALLHFNLTLGKKTVLILGGSLGARRINQLVVNQIIDLIPKGIQLLWQCGTLYYDQYQSYDQREGVKVLPFIEKMDLAYAAADIILSRAGALSVSELCIVGKPVVFIPSPNVTDDHQTKNAQAIVMKKGALMMKETELEDHFGTLFTSLLQNDSLQRDMTDHIKKLAKPNATKDIVDVMMSGLNHKRKYLNNKELTINHEK